MNGTTIPAARPLTMLVCALGGEGGGVLAEWLVDTATRCGHAAQSTSIPGVAQRTGATTYYVEIDSHAQREGRRVPVFSLYPVPGALDLLVASELLEAVRQVAGGLVSPERTHVIASSARTLTTFEKMHAADGRASSDTLATVLREHSRALHLFDMAEAAAGAGTVISAVMLGAIAGSGLLPFPQHAFEATIRAAGKGVEASLAGFARGHAAMSGDADASTSTRPPAQRRWSALPGEVAERFPPATHDIVAVGYARMREFQDEAYARSYVERLARVLAVEREADPEARNGFAATRETARFLGAWMAFDDIVRVADLKSRASRFDRVRDEVRAAPEDVVRIYDHFKPGIAEFTSLLPARLADRLQRWDRRRIAEGKEAFAVPLKLPAHSVLGLLALRSLASLKGLRRHGYRYAAEQEAMERWLAAVEAGLRRDWALGHEIALCGRLVKGYGATNERGKEHLLHVVAHVASSGDFADDDARRRAIRALRESSLADDTGRSLDRALVQHGAPPRPVKAQPVTWVKSRPGGRAPRKVA